MSKDYIYMIGIFLFGLVYYVVKSFTENDVLFVLGAIIYLLLLRCVAEYFGKSKN
jgi:hypothetical protein